MIRVVITYFLFCLCLVSSCASPRVTRKFISKEKNSFSDTLHLQDYMICYIPINQSTVHLDASFEDSLLGLFANSLVNDSITIIKSKGVNLVDYFTCDAERRANRKEIIKSINEKFKQDNVNNEKTVLIPLIKIVESVSSRHPGDMTASIYIAFRMTIFVYQGTQLVYYAVAVDGINNPWYLQTQKEWENGNFSNIPIDNHIEPAHWDTLVGLVMKEYIERLK